MEKTIHISVRNKIATVNKDALYVCGNTDYVVVFDFDAEWDDFDIKTARFIHDGEFTDVVFSGNQCEIPAIFDVIGLKIGVFSGDLSTTTPVYIRAIKSILCDDEPPADPPPDVYSQLMAVVNEIKEAVRDVRDDANAGKFNGRGIARIEYDKKTWRWNVVYTDGSIDSFDGHNPADSALWTFFRDDFNNYSIGKNVFAEQAGSNWQIPNAYVSNVSHDVVENGDNKYLRLRCLTADARAVVIPNYQIQGEFIVEFDYMPTRQGSVEQGKTATDFFDIRLFTVGEYAISARVNYKGINRIYTAITGKKQQSPIINDSAGNFYLCKPGVWYRVKVYVQVGKVTMKIWKRDSESEPSNNSKFGVTSCALDVLTPELVATPHFLQFCFRDFGEAPPTTEGWRMGFDNVSVWRDIKTGV